MLADAAHQDSAAKLPTMQALLQQADAAGQEHVQAGDFVAALQLSNISLWCSHDDGPVVLDYRLDPEGNDQILAVKCDAQGNITEIVWES